MALAEPAPKPSRTCLMTVVTTSNLIGGDDDAQPDSEVRTRSERAGILLEGGRVSDVPDSVPDSDDVLDDGVIRYDASERSGI